MLGCGWGHVLRTQRLGAVANLPNEGSSQHPGPARAPAADRALFGTAENLCAVPAKNRVDCGYPQISPEQCVNRGCCFDSSIPEVPWCFKPLQDTGERPREPRVPPGPPREASRSPGSRAHPGGTASTVTVHRGGGLSQRRRAQGGQLPGAVPCRPFVRRFVRTMKAVFSKRCSKSRHCVQGTSLKTILERSGKHTGLGSWADIRGLALQTKHRHL